MVPQKEGGFSLFRLFGVVSSLFQPVIACHGLFRFVSHFTSNDVAKCFDLQIFYKSTSCRFYYKGRASVIINWDSLDILQSRASVITKWDSFLYYKVGQVVLQSRAGLPSRATFVIKWGSYYKMTVLCRRQMRETRESNRFWQPTP